MDINIIQDNSIIICENNYKNYFLKKLTKKRLFLNVKFYSKKEFLAKYFFTYDERAIYYLTQKYDYKVSVAKMYLNNLYFIDETKNYKETKLQRLVDLKKELNENNLLIYDNFFKNSLKNKKTLVIDYPYLENFELDLFAKLDAHILLDSNIFNHDSVYEFNTIEDEITFVAKKICKLIKDDIDINQIKLVNVTDEYYLPLERIFSFYNLPVNIPVKSALYSTKVAKEFLKYYDSDINKTIAKINADDTNVLNKIINICNKYTFVNNYNDVKSLIIDDLKNTRIDNFKLKNYIEIKTINEPFSEDNYVFLMNFNMGSIPVCFKDEDYISDNIKKETSLKETVIINKEVKEYTIQKINSIKNLFITYKLKSSTNDFYPSSLIDMMNLKVLKEKYNFLDSYSMIQDKLDFAKKLDLLNKYGTFDESLVIYQNTFSDIGYNSYDNTFKGIDSNYLKRVLNNKLVLSYSSLNNYNKCAFRYYLANILKLDIYEEKFETFVGSLFHDVLEKCFINDLNVADEIKNYITKENKILSVKELFFINKIQKDIEFVITTLKKQNLHISLDKALYEKNIVIPKQADLKVEFVGFIDKILYKEMGDKTLVSIIDYKTGYVDTDLKYAEYGLNLQLPIYLYLVKKSNLFKNPKFIGFYLQYILDKDIVRDNQKTYLMQKEDNLKLMGYSLNEKDLLEMFDDTYQNSDLIKGMKTKADGNFSTYSKVLSSEQINKLIDFTEKNIDLAIHNILAGNFAINPKKIGYEKDLGCKFCKFKDLCFKKENDYVILDEPDKNSFLGGDEND